jgi:hypothetical protein
MSSQGDIDDVTVNSELNFIPRNWRISTTPVCRFILAIGDALVLASVSDPHPFYADPDPGSGFMP